MPEQTAGAEQVGAEQASADEARAVERGAVEPDPIWRATVEMVDHARDPDVPDDSGLDAQDLPD
jgi:hypothetical protein